MEIGSVIETLGDIVDTLGVLAIIIGIAYAMLDAGIRGLRRQRPIYTRFRRVLGRSILLGLEFLVAADIIKTVAVAPTLESVAVLGLIVLIRTFLSWALELEMTGRWPWQKPPEPVAAGEDGGTAPR